MPASNHNLHQGFHRVTTVDCTVHRIGAPLPQLWLIEQHMVHVVDRIECRAFGCDNKGHQWTLALHDLVRQQEPVAMVECEGQHLEQYLIEDHGEGVDIERWPIRWTILVNDLWCHKLVVPR